MVSAKHPHKQNRLVWGPGHYCFRRTLLMRPSATRLVELTPAPIMIFALRRLLDSRPAEMGAQPHLEAAVEGGLGRSQKQGIVRKEFRSLQAHSVTDAKPGMPAQQEHGCGPLPTPLCIFAAGMVKKLAVQAHPRINVLGGLLRSASSHRTGPGRDTLVLADKSDPLAAAAPLVISNIGCRGEDSQGSGECRPRSSWRQYSRNRPYKIRTINFTYT
jgi:hypothetical protein